MKTPAGTTFIFEIPVYDGSQKVWRVLNITSGTVYSPEYETEDEANAAIEDGTKRAGSFVVRSGRALVQTCLAEAFTI